MPLSWSYLPLLYTGATVTPPTAPINVCWLAKESTRHSVALGQGSLKVTESGLYCWKLVLALNGGAESLGLGPCAVWQVTSPFWSQFLHL